eukprot:g2720.t1
MSCAVIERKAMDPEQIMSLDQAIDACTIALGEESDKFETKSAPSKNTFVPKPPTTTNLQKRPHFIQSRAKKEKVQSNVELKNVIEDDFSIFDFEASLANVVRKSSYPSDYRRRQRKRLSVPVPSKKLHVDNLLKSGSIAMTSLGLEKRLNYRKNPLQPLVQMEAKSKLEDLAQRHASYAEKGWTPSERIASAYSPLAGNLSPRTVIPLVTKKLNPKKLPKKKSMGRKRSRQGYRIHKIVRRAKKRYNPVNEKLVYEACRMQYVIKNTKGLETIDMKAEDFDVVDEDMLTKSRHAGFTGMQWCDDSLGDINLRMNGETPAVASLTFRGAWNACGVLRFDPVRKEYLVRFTSQGNTVWVSRMNLRFIAENEDDYFLRRERIIERFERARYEIRYREFIKYQKIADLNNTFIDINNLIDQRLLTSNAATEIHQLLKQEVQDQYMDNMKRACAEYTLKKYCPQMKIKTFHDNMKRSLNIATTESTRTKSKTNIIQKRKTMMFRRHIWAIEGFLPFFHRLKKQWQLVRTQKFIDSSFLEMGKIPLTLRNFSTHQRICLVQALSSLRTDWYQYTLDAMEGYLASLRQTHSQTQNQSQRQNQVWGHTMQSGGRTLQNFATLRKRIIRSMTYMMSSQLFYYVHQALNIWWKDIFYVLNDYRSPEAVQDSIQDDPPESPGGISPISRQRKKKQKSRNLHGPPLFLVDLVVVEESVQFSPPLQEILDTCTGVTTRLLDGLQDFKTLEISLDPESSKGGGGDESKSLFSVCSDVDAFSAEVEHKQSLLLEKMVQMLEPVRSILHRYEAYVSKIQSEDALERIVKALDRLGELKGKEEDRGVCHEIESTICNEMDILIKMKNEIHSNFTKDVIFEFIQVNCSRAKRYLLDCISDAIDKAAHLILQEGKRLIREAKKTYEKIEIFLKEPVEKWDNLDAKRQFINDLELKRKEIHFTKAEPGEMLLQTLFDRCIPIARSELISCLHLKRWPNKIKIAETIAHSLRKQMESKFVNELLTEQKSFEQRLEVFRKDIAAFIEFGNLEDALKIGKNVDDISKRLEKAKKKVTNFTSREKLFGRPITKYKKLDLIIADFKPYQVLWITAWDWRENEQNWTVGLFRKIDPVKVKTLTEQWAKDVSNCKKIFQALPQPLAVAKTLLHQIEEFSTHIHLITCLRDHALRDRHWSKIAAIIGKDPVDINPEQNLTLQNLLDYKIKTHIGFIEGICATAKKEYEAEFALKKMHSKWENLAFKVQPYAYHESGVPTLILLDIDGYIELLDDDIVESEVLKSNPGVAPILDEVLEWLALMERSVQLFELWKQVQKMYLFLLPIFSVEEIRRQLPREGNRFLDVDTQWRNMLERVERNPATIWIMRTSKKLSSVNSGKVRDICEYWFQKRLTTLENIIKATTEYLNLQRERYPRFYFSSDQALLHILSSCVTYGDVDSVLYNFYDSFKSFYTEEHEKKKQICGVIGANNELIKWDRPIGECSMKLHGEIDGLFSAIDSSMEKTLRDLLIKTLKSHPSGSWHEVIDKGLEEGLPHQILLARSYVLWSRETEMCLKKYTTTLQLQNVLRIMQSELEYSVQLLRNAKAKTHFQTYENLLMLDAHLINVTNSLVSQGVTSSDAFEWLAHLRAYLEVNQSSLVFCSMNVRIPYGFHYIRPYNRLFVTPLVEKCFREIFSAMHFKSGLALSGNSSTKFKASICSELSNTLALPHFVVHCSATMGLAQLKRFMRGLEVYGSSICFKEISALSRSARIQFAQQMFSTVSSFRKNDFSRRNSGNNRSSLNQRPLYLGLCISGNFYENNSNFNTLRSAFWRVVVSDSIRPDASVLIGSRLLCLGIRQSSKLGRLIMMASKIIDFELGQGDDFQWDLSINKITDLVRTAMVDKKDVKLAEKDELLIVRNAMDRVVSAKYGHSGHDKLRTVLNEVFVAADSENTNSSKVGKYVKEMYFVFFPEKTKDEKVRMTTPQCVLELAKSTKVFHEMMSSHRCAIVTGPAMSGKSTVIQTVRNMCGDEAHMVPMHLGSLSIEQLFGSFELDGLLSILFRGFQENAQKSSWVLFDGPIQSNLSFALQGLLENGPFISYHGETIHVPNAKVIFETRSLRNAPPSIFNSCGLFTLSSQPELEKSMLKVVIFQRPFMKSYDRFKPNIRVQMEVVFKLFKKTLNLARGRILMNYDSLVYRFLNLFEIMVPHYVSPSAPSKEDQFSKVILYAAIVSGVANFLNDNDRVTFGNMVRAHLITHKAFANQKLPKNCTLDRLILRKEDDGGGIDVLNFFDAARHESLHAGKINTFYPNADILLHDFKSIYIPTPRLVAIQETLKMMTELEQNVILIGEVSSGKTSAIMRHLQQLAAASRKGKNVDVRLPEGFSHRFSGGKTDKVNILMKKLKALLKRRRSRVFGPPNNEKLVIYIDDLSIDNHNECSTTEMLRQLYAHPQSQGWYDPSSGDGKIHEIRDTNVLCSMQSEMVMKDIDHSALFRHFFIVPCGNFSRSDLSLIMRGIIEIRHGGRKLISPTVKTYLKEIVKVVLETHELVKKEFVSLPSNQYCALTTIQTILKIMQGFCIAKDACFETKNDCTHLVLHEMYRTYNDAIKDTTDKEQFLSLLKDTTKKVLMVNFDEAVNLKSFMYGCFMKPKDDVVRETDAVFRRRSMHSSPLGSSRSSTRKHSTPNILQPEDDERIQLTLNNYRRLKGEKAIKQRIDNSLKVWLFQVNGRQNAEYLHECNRISPHVIEVFSQTISLLTSFCRIISKPGGHVICSGPKCSGKKTLVFITRNVLQYRMYLFSRDSFHPSTQRVLVWMKFFKKIISNNIAVTLGEETEETYILTITTDDVRYFGEIILQDVVTLMRGEILDCISYDELTSMMQLDVKKLSDTKLKHKFNELVSRKIRIVLCVDLDDFQLRCSFKRFRTLLNYASLLWVKETSKDDVLGLAKHHVEKMKISRQSTKDAVVRQCRSMFIYANLLAEEYKLSKFGINHYLAQIGFLRRYHSRKVKELKRSIKCINKAKDQTESCRDEVERLHAEMRVTKPQHERHQKHFEELVESIEVIKKTMMDLTQEMINKRQLLATLGEEVKRCDEMIGDDVEKGRQKLIESVQPVKDMKKSTINELKKLISGGKATKTVKLVMEIVSRLLSQHDQSAKLDDGDDDSAAFDKSIVVEHLNDSTWRSRLLKIERLDEERAKPLLPHRKVLDRSRKRLLKESKGAATIAIWLQNLLYYNNVLFVNADKISKRDNVRKELKEVQEALSKIDVNMQQTKETLSKKTKTKERTENKLAGLQEKLDNTSEKVRVSSLLLEALEKEELQWNESLQSKKIHLQNALGDHLLASGLLTYGGFFSSSKRASMMDHFRRSVEKEKAIDVSEHLDLTRVLGVSETTASVPGSSQESYSTNTLLLESTKSCRFIIDPYGEGKKWLQRRRKNMKSFQSWDNNLVHKIFNLLGSDNVVMIENVIHSQCTRLYTIFHAMWYQNEYEHDKALFSVEYKGKDYRLHSACELYLHTRNLSTEVPSDFVSNVVFVDFTLTGNEISDVIFQQFLTRMKPDLADAIRHISVKNSKLESSIRDQEKKVIQLLYECEGSILDNENDIVETLQTLTTDLNNFRSEIQEIQSEPILEMKKIVSRTADQATAVFMVVEACQKICNNFCWSFEWYVSEVFANISLMKNHLEQNDILKNIVHGVAKEISFALPSNAYLMFLLTVKFRIDSVPVNNDDAKQSSTDAEYFEGFGQQQEFISSDEWEHFTGATQIKFYLSGAESKIHWMADTTKNRLKQLELVNKAIFGHLCEDIVIAPSKWKEFYEKPKLFNILELPDPYNSLDPFRELMIIKALCPGIFLEKAKAVLMDDPMFAPLLRFKYSVVSRIGNCLSRSSPMKPIVFINENSDQDAMFLFEKFYNESSSGNKKYLSVSFGGSGGENDNSYSVDDIVDLIVQAQTQGKWIFIQDCHFQEPWLHNVCTLIEDLDLDYCDESFRLFLVCTRSTRIPYPLLVRSQKVGLAQPWDSLPANIGIEGINQNSITDAPSSSSQRQRTLPKTIIAAICQLHLCTQNSVFSWTTKDKPYSLNLIFCIQTIQILAKNITRYGDTKEQHSKLRQIASFVIQQMTYTNSFAHEIDLKLVKQLVDVLLLEGQEQTKKDMSMSSIVEEFCSPHVVYNRGTTETKESMKLLHKLMQRFKSKDNRIADNTEEDDYANEDILEDNIEDLIEQLEESIVSFDLEAARRNYRSDYTSTLNVVLHQEISHLQILRDQINADVQAIQETSKGGRTHYSKQIQAVERCIMLNKVPKTWVCRSIFVKGTSNLQNWVAEVKRRFLFYHQWLEEGRPGIFDAPCFAYFRNFFLHLRIQHSRELGAPLDAVSLTYTIDPKEFQAFSLCDHDDGGYRWNAGSLQTTSVLCDGLFIRGAKWYRSRMTISDSPDIRSVINPFPIIQVEARDKNNGNDKDRELNTEMEEEAVPEKADEQEKHPEPLGKSMSAMHGKARSSAIMKSSEHDHQLKPFAEMRSLTKKTLVGSDSAKIEEFAPDNIIRFLNSKFAAIERGDDDKVFRLPFAQKLHTVAFFADISGFTKLSEHLNRKFKSKKAKNVFRMNDGPEWLAHYINQYFGLLLKNIARTGGDVIKFAGDALLVCWPEYDGDRELDMKKRIYRAVKCGLDTQNELQEAELAKDVILNVKIGVGLGEVSIIHVGGVLNRVEYLATGGAFLQAFECENHATKGEVVISSEAYALAKNDFECELIPDSTVYRVSKCVKVQRIRKLRRMRPGEQVVAMLKRYIPAGVLSYLDSNQMRWSAETRTITVMFLDLGFAVTGMHTLNTDVLIRIQNCLQRVQRAVYTYEGSLNKFLFDDKGSTILIVFGLTPLAHENDPTRGVLSALTMQSMLGEIGQTTYIGLTTGICFCGPIGANGNRREYSVLGDTVNTSARLMSYAGKDATRSRIFCDKTTKYSADSHNGIAFKDPISITLKGKSKPTQMFEAHLLEGSKSQLLSVVKTVKEQWDREPFCGVLADLKETVATFLKKTTRRQGEKRFVQSVFLSGDNGVGKSLLFQQLLKAIINEHGTKPSLAERSSEHRKFSHVLSLTEKVTQNKRDRLIVCVGASELFEQDAKCACVWHRIFDQLVNDKQQIEKKARKELAKLREEVYSSPAFKSPEELSEQDLYVDDAVQLTLECEALEKAINTFGKYHKVFIMLDEAHNMSDRDWQITLNLHNTFKTAKHCPLLTVIATRPVESRKYKPFFRDTSAAYKDMLRDLDTEFTEMEPLRADELRSLLVHQFGTTRISEALIHVVKKMTGGNPLYIVKFCDSLLKTELVTLSNIENDDGVSEIVATFRVDRLNDDVNFVLPLPYKVQRVISTFLDRLEPPEVLLLKCASILCIGDGPSVLAFDISLLASLFPYQDARASFYAGGSERIASLVDRVKAFGLISVWEDHDDTAYINQQPDENLDFYRFFNKGKFIRSRRFMFSCGLIRDVVYNRMLGKQKRLLHKIAAVEIEGTLNKLMQEKKKQEEKKDSPNESPTDESPPEDGGEKIYPDEIEKFNKMLFRHYQAAENEEKMKEYYLKAFLKKSRLANKNRTPTMLWKSLKSAFNKGKKERRLSQRILLELPKKPVENHRKRARKTVQTTSKKKSTNLTRPPSFTKMGTSMKSVKLPSSPVSFASCFACFGRGTPVASDTQTNVSVIPEKKEKPSVAAVTSVEKKSVVQESNTDNAPKKEQSASSEKEAEKEAAIVKTPAPEVSTPSTKLPQGPPSAKKKKSPLDRLKKPKMRRVESLSSGINGGGASPMKKITSRIQHCTGSLVISGRNSIYMDIRIMKLHYGQMMEITSKMILRKKWQSKNERRFWIAIADVNKWDFDIFNFRKVCNGWPLLCLGSALFLKLNIEKELGIDRQVFANCVATIEKGYIKSNPYHNSLHAADVLQTAHCMLRIERKTHQHTRHDVFLLLFSCIIHDYKHPGLNSQYLIKSKDKIALKYNNIQVLENFHVAEAFKDIQRSKTDIDILAQLRTKSSFSVSDNRQMVIELVLSTSLSEHFDFINTFSNIIDQGVDLVKEEHRKLALMMAIKAADVGNCSKPFFLYKQWANLIVLEFYKQGKVHMSDVERKKGMEVSNYMDRNNPDVHTCQMNFMNFIVKPLYKLVGTYAPPCRDLFKSYLNYNYEFWTEKDDVFSTDFNSDNEVSSGSFTMDIKIDATSSRQNSSGFIQIGSRSSPSLPIQAEEMDDEDDEGQKMDEMFGDPEFQPKDEVSLIKPASPQMEVRQSEVKEEETEGEKEKEASEEKQEQQEEEVKDAMVAVTATEKDGSLKLIDFSEGEKTSTSDQSTNLPSPNNFSGLPVIPKQFSTAMEEGGSRSKRRALQSFSVGMQHTPHFDFGPRSQDKNGADPLPQNKQKIRHKSLSTVMMEEGILQNRIRSGRTDRTRSTILLNDPTKYKSGKFKTIQRRMSVSFL